MFNHLQTFLNLCENLYLMLLMLFFNLEVLKKKPTKSIRIMPHLELSKTCVFRTKKLKRKIKLQLIWTYEIWLNFNHSKVFNY